jgi:hypothetical protein
MTLCRRHRFSKGVPFALRSIILDLFNVGPASMLGIAFENLRGGRVVPGDTSDLMEQLATSFSRQGKEPEAAKAKALAAQFRSRRDQEIAAIERAQRDEERRLGL